jgi:hypothetical protein
MRAIKNPGSSTPSASAVSPYISCHNAVRPLTALWKNDVPNHMVT